MIVGVVVGGLVGYGIAVAFLLGVRAFEKRFQQDAERAVGHAEPPVRAAA